MRSLFPSLVPLFIVLIIIIARRPATLLRRRGAVSAETAQPLTDADLRSGDRARLERLVRQGVVREAAPGAYYYDQVGERARMRRQLPILLAIIAALLLVLLALTVWGPRRATARVRTAPSGPDTVVVQVTAGAMDSAFRSLAAVS